MVVAALANWVIVYFLFAYNMPLDKIENTEGVITAVSERFVFYFLAQVISYMIGRCATRLVMQSKFTGYKLEEAYPQATTESTFKELQNMTINEIAEDDVVSQAAHAMVANNSEVIKLVDQTLPDQDKYEFFLVKREKAAGSQPSLESSFKFD